MWRQQRVQRLAARLQSKQKDQNKPLSSKILGFKAVKTFKMDSMPSSTSSSKMDVRMSSSTTSLNQYPTKSIPSTMTGNVKKLPRCISEPKIIPRETKLSLQRKSMLDPRYKLKKHLENSSMNLGKSGLEKLEELATNGKKKHDKYPCPKVVVHSCNDVPSVKKDPTSLPPFSPLVRGLDSWLMKHGKRFTSFVGLRNVATRDPISFITLPDLEEGESTSSSPTNTSTSTVIIGQDIKMLLESGLNDLSTLIRMGYPIKDCENWLTAMRDHYTDLIRYPLYWECRASINSKMGTKSDIENNNKDIPAHVNDLVNKLKHLNLDTAANVVGTEFKTPKKNRVLTDISVNNVINSSAIKFSVKTADKEVDKSFVVTPVRRSARKCQCSTQRRDTNICVPSLLDLTDDVRENMKFEPNLALK
ncbi:hypothetical protein O3M35_010105 [Rhynocoris fuscipes]